MSSKKIKILFVSNTANFQKFNRPFMRWSREQSWQVDYASAGEEPILDCDNEFKIDLARSPFSFKNFTALKQMKKILEENHYDIIHCHTPMGGVVARLAGKKYRKSGLKIIYTAHGFHFYKGAPILNWLIYYPVEKWLSKYTDVLITINKEDFELAKRKFGKYTDVRFMNGVGIDLSRFSPLSDDEILKTRKEFGYKNDDFIIAVVAECNKNKNQTFLIERIPELKKQIPNLKVLFVGKETLDLARKKVCDLGVSDVCEFLGYRNDVDKIEKISDICFSASIREGLGLNIVEGMACGKVCVCSKNRGHSSLIESGRNGLLFDLSDSDGMVNEILSVYKDRQLASQLARQAHMDSVMYDVKTAVDKTVDIYNKIGGGIN